MRIAFDLDNTLVDELGKSTRPGVRDLLIKLRQDRHTLILFTQSTRQRARIILDDHDLKELFDEFFFREDWDQQNVNPPKDVRLVNADALIDDDPKHIEFTRSLGRRGILVRPYRGGRGDPREIVMIQRTLRVTFLDRIKALIPRSRS